MTDLSLYASDIVRRQHLFGHAGVATPLATMIGALAAVICIAAPTSFAQGDEVLQSAMTLERIIRGMEASRAELKSLLVQYTRVCQAMAEDCGPWPWNEVTFAFKGQMRYVEHRRPESGKIVRTVGAYDGRVSREQVGKKTYVINEIRSRYTEIDWYTIYTFMPVVEAVRESGGDFCLPNALRQPGYRLLSEQERVDGHPCYVVERPGRDRLWVDPAIGFAVRRRIHQHPPGTFMSSHYDLSAFEQVAASLWLPKTIVRKSYLRQSSSMHKPLRLAFQETIRVSRLVANQVPDELFVLKFPPGTWVTDFRETMHRGRYRVPAPGENPLESSIAAARAEPPRRMSPGLRLLASLCVILLSVSLVVVILLRLRRCA